MGARRTIRSTVGALALAAGLVALPSTAHAQEADAAPATLAEAMEGVAPGLEVEAFSAFHTSPMDTMLVEIEVTNDGGAPAALAIPPGTLLETDVEGDQTFGVAGPYEDPAAVAASTAGEVPTITAPPGESTFVLQVLCTQRDDGAPVERTPLSYAGMAAEPLPTVLRNIVAQEADPTAAQDAVWWVTDEPTSPVPDHIAPLLAGVDAEAFAAAPHEVVPDTQYVPGWQRSAVLDESFDGGSSSSPALPIGSGASGANPLVWLAVLAALAGVVAVAVHLGRRRPTPAAAPATTMRAGWYPDPFGGGGHRYWDGRAWTTRVMARR